MENQEQEPLGIIETKKIFDLGGSHTLTLPKTAVKYLELEIGTEVKVACYRKKKGKFIAIWIE